MAPALPDVLQFMQLLWAVVHALDTRSKRMARDLGVTGPQRLVLRVVGLRPGMSAGALAAVIHLHPSTLTGVLQRLVQQKLLARTTDVADGRRAILHLTAAGARVNRVSRGTVEHAVASALAGLDRRDHDAATRVLSLIATRLQHAPAPRTTARVVASARRRKRSA